MNSKQHGIDEAELHAYVDGVLPESRRAAIEAAISVDSEIAGMVHVYRTQNEALHGQFGAIVDEPVPDRLNPRRLEARFRRRRWIINVAASAAWLALGLGGGWLAHGWFGAGVSADATRAVAREAVSAHRVYVVEVRHPVEVFADEEGHLVKWLSKRLGYAIRRPDLTPLGYRLVGGRLLPTEDGAPAAQFMYEDPSGRRLTLYVSRNETGETTAFRYQEMDGVGAFIWLEADMGFAISGEMPREMLLKASTLVYEALEAPT